MRRDSVKMMAFRPRRARGLGEGASSALSSASPLAFRSMEMARSRSVEVRDFGSSARVGSGAAAAGSSLGPLLGGLVEAS